MKITITGDASRVTWRLEDHRGYLITGGSVGATAMTPDPWATAFANANRVRVNIEGSRT